MTHVMALLKKKETKQRENYLTGAPRDCAGFSMTVMVVSVSFRGVSVSYSGIDGAVEQQKYLCFCKSTSRRESNTKCFLMLFVLL